VSKGTTFLSQVWRMCGRAFVAAYRDNAFGSAKAPPIPRCWPSSHCSTAATILVRFQAEFISDAIYNFLSEILPPGTQDLVFYYFAVRGKQPVFVPITACSSRCGGLGVMVSLMEGQHGLPRAAGPSLVRERVIAILLVFSAAIPVLFASGMIFFGIRAEHWIVDVMGWRRREDSCGWW